MLTGWLSLPQVDTAQLFSDMFEEITGIRPIDGTNMPASFTHLAYFYDAQYYGYLVRSSIPQRVSSDNTNIVDPTFD